MSFFCDHIQKQQKKAKGAVTLAMFLPKNQIHCATYLTHNQKLVSTLMSPGVGMFFFFLKISPLKGIPLGIPGDNDITSQAITFL